MKQLLVIACAISLSACAAKTFQYDVAGIDQSESAQVVDRRPASEKKSELFSSLITSKKYGLYRRGDEIMQPPSLRVLQHRAFEKFGADAGPIEVEHFVIYMNLKSELRRGAIGGALGGLIGAAVAAGTKKNEVPSVSEVITFADFAAMADEEYMRALYTQEENPNKASVMIVYVGGSMGGKRVMTRTMVPTKLPEGQIPHAAAVEAASTFFLDQF